MDMTKQAIRALFGLRNDAGLAKLLGVTRSAVAQWPDCEPIPLHRQWQLKAMRPELFKVKRKAAA